MGGVAVIATLVYLGLQLRVSNQIESAENHRAVVKEFNEQVLGLRTPEEAEIYWQGINGFDRLPRDRQIVVHCALSRMLYIGEQIYLLAPRVVDDADAADSANRSIVSVLRHAGLATWWRRTYEAKLFDLGYLEYLQSMIDRGAAPPLGDVLPWLGPDAAEEA